MSISSCPQCGKQVTIPSGVGTSTKVRCPLCRAQYTLADALVNMPPLLELVEEDVEDYLDTQPAIPGGLTIPTVDYFREASTKEPLADVDFGADDQIEPAATSASADEPSLDELGLDAPLDLDSTTAYEQADEGHSALDLDDLTVEEKDTEVEEFAGFSPEPIKEAPEEVIAFESAAADDDVLDFSAALDADAPLAGSVEDEVPIQFEDEFSAGSASEGEVLAFDMVEPLSGDEEPSIDFGEPIASGPNIEGEEIALDFGQPVEAIAPVIGAVEGEVSEEAEIDTKGKKKKKKEKKQKVKAVAEDGAPRPKRRLSTVLSATLGGILGLAVALYGIFWLGPDYDFVGLGKMLPKAMVPGSFNTRTLVSAQKPAFNLPPSTPPEQPAPELPADQPAPDAAEPAAEAPAAESTTAPADDTTTPEAEPGNTPADNMPAEAPSETPAPAPSDTETLPSAPPEQPSLSPPAEANATPSEPAATTPEPDPLATPAEPADDPFAPAEAPTVPSGTPEEMPAETPAADVTDGPPATAPPTAEPGAPADVDPFAPPATDPAAPATDPTTPAPPAAEPPAADAPAEEMPTPADDPFAESTTRPAPADDPFADSSPAPAVPAEPVTPEPVVGPVAAIAVTPDALATAIQDAEVADQRMVAAQGTTNETDLKKIRSNFYVSLFRMADGATFVQDAGNSDQLDAMRQQMDRLVRQLAADPKRKESLKYNAGRWLEFPRRTTPGIVLAGKVQSVEPVGKLHEIKLNIGLENAAESVVSVLSANDPGLKGGDEALVLGTIVENPAEQLAGYEGAETTVVWNGMLLTLPSQ